MDVDGGGREVHTQLLFEYALWVSVGVEISKIRAEEADLSLKIRGFGNANLEHLHIIKS